MNAGWLGSFQGLQKRQLRALLAGHLEHVSDKRTVGRQRIGARRARAVRGLRPLAAARPGSRPSPACSVITTSVCPAALALRRGQRPQLLAHPAPARGTARPRACTRPGARPGSPAPPPSAGSRPSRARTGSTRAGSRRACRAPRSTAPAAPVLGTGDEVRVELRHPDREPLPRRRRGRDRRRRGVAFAAGACGRGGAARSRRHGSARPRRRPAARTPQPCNTPRRASSSLPPRLPAHVRSRRR